MHWGHNLLMHSLKNITQPLYAWPPGCKLEQTVCFRTKQSPALLEGSVNKQGNESARVMMSESQVARGQWDKVKMYNSPEVRLCITDTFPQLEFSGRQTTGLIFPKGSLKIRNRYQDSPNNPFRSPRSMQVGKNFPRNVYFSMNKDRELISKIAVCI